MKGKAGLSNFISDIHWPK